MSQTTGQEFFPLSLNQRNIWNLEQMYSGTPMNHISTTIRIEGRIDMKLLEKSIQLVLEADATLRTRIAQRDGEPMCYQVPFEKEKFLIYDFSNTNRDGIQNWEYAVAREAMQILDAPLYRFELFRTGDTSGGVLVKLHHLISDGWSQLLVCKRISELYLSLLAGKEPEIEEIPNYNRYVLAEETYLSSRAYNKDREYWTEMLGKRGAPMVLKPAGSAVLSPVGRRLSFSFPETLNHAVYQFCSKHRAAPFAVFYMALAIYARRLGGEKYSVLGVPVVNRTSYEFKKSTGMFVSTLPFICEIDEKWNFEEFHEHMQESWYELLRHQRFPYEKIEELKAGENMDQPLFEMAFSYQDGKIMENKDAALKLSGRWHYSGYQSEQLCIHLSNLENERKYAVDYDYLTQLFSKDEIRRFHETLECIMVEALHNPYKPISQLNILKHEERERVLYGVNRTYRYVPEESLGELLTKVSDAHPQKAALIMDGQRLTYHQLYENASFISSNMKKMGLCPGQVTAILMKKSFALYEMMAAAMLTGCGWVLLSDDLPEKRIQKILENCGASLLVTKAEGIEAAAEKSQIFDKIRVISYEQLKYEQVEDETSGDDTKSGQVLKNDLAYIVYTSGSTGEPKGVEISQGNLLNLVQSMKPIYGRSAVLSVCKISFDAFILESAAAFLNGQTIVLASNEDCESPVRLANLLKSYGAGFISLTPSRLSAYMQENEFLHSLRQMEGIICGGEAFPAVLLNKLKTVTQAKIYNQYGPSETTVAAAIKELNHAEHITIGKPMANCRIYVLDAWKNPVPTGIYGEVYIGGRCVGLGYRNNEKLTKNSFFDNPFEEGDTIYRTGDLACWNEDGELVLAGRIDSQIKLRGQRIELLEITSNLKEHELISEAVVRVEMINGQEVLTAYYTGQDISEIKLRSYLASLLPGYMIPDIFLHLAAMPVSQNGKIDEKNLYQFIPKDIMERQIKEGYDKELALRIAEIFSDVLESEDLTEHSDYFLCGGNSLSGIEVISEVEERLGIKIRISDLYACRTAAGLAAFIQEDESLYGCINHTGKKEYKKAPLDREYELTALQQGMYVQSMMEPELLIYHMPGAFRIEGNLDTKRLERSFVKLMKGDPIFRTSFFMSQNMVKARISSNVEFELEILHSGKYEDACREFLRPFSMECAPLFRAGCWQETERTWILFMDCHHMIGDGMSMPIMMKRLNEIYKNQESQEAKWNFYDHLYNKKETREETKKYWKAHLSPIVLPVKIPEDNKKKFQFRGEKSVYVFSHSLSEKIDVFCENHRMTPFMILSGMWAVLYARATGAKKVVVGTPVLGRDTRETMEALGPFINTLPLCFAPSADKKIKDYLEEIKTKINHMIEYDDISLEDLLSLLSIPRQADGNGLYQVMISMRPFETSSLFFDEKQMEYMPIENDTVKLDWVVEAAKEDGCYQIQYEYASCHERKTADLYARALESLMEALVMAGSNEEAMIGELPLMSGEDEFRLVEEPMAGCTPFMNLPVHRQIENVMRRQPSQTAVIWHDEKISYGRLYEMTEEYTKRFRSAGIIKGERVGIMCERTPMLYAALLAILKVGGVYVPLLPSFPEKRIMYMLKMAEAKKLLCDTRTYEELPENLKETAIDWEVDICEKINDKPDEQVHVSGNDLIHILFTSGSTGNPKGVMIEHHSISNLVGISREWYKDITGPMMAATTITFDIFASEGLVPLALGKTIVLADEEEMFLPWRLAQLIKKYECEFIQFTASRLWMCLNNDAFCDAIKSLKFTIVGGEAVSGELVERFYKFCDGNLVNLYGPTEATVYATMQILSGQEPVTIGKPIPNYRIYLLDKEKRPVMPTAAGEIYIAGQGVARGYVGRPDLTEKSFLPDPYYPGEKMYRSGDMGKLRADGKIEYLGRIDGQIKINGQRVELEEIEVCMRKSELTSQAVVLPLKNPDGSSWLCGFYVDSMDTREKMMEFLRAELPKYMVPARLILLSKLPLTEGGKTDRQKLMQMVEHQEADKSIEKVNLPEPDKKNEPSMAEKMRAIWKETLGVKNIDEKTSFFEQGGTSLGALSVLSQYFNEGIEMTMEQFYHHTTLNDQILLCKKEEKAEKKEEIPHYPWHTRQGGRIKERPEKTLFFTGASGYFGAHLLRELLEDGAVHVYCLVRGGKEALCENLSWYFGKGWTAAHADYLEVVKGELGEPYFGLEKERFEELSALCEAVYHCAADVRHYVSEQKAMDAVNVEGTKQIIQFALRSSIPLHYMSTASVAGNHLIKEWKNGTFSYTEDDFDIGQNWMDNAYVRSKFLAEALIYQAMEKDRLKAHIYRLGLLTQRREDGVFQKNADTNAAWMLVKGAKELGVLPERMCREYTDQMPVDMAAHIVRLLSYSSKSVFHVVHPKPPRLGRIIKDYVQDIKEVSDEEFEEILKQEWKYQDHQIIAPLIDRWNQLKEEKNAIKIDSHETYRELEHLGFDMKIWGEKI